MISSFFQFFRFIPKNKGGFSMKVPGFGAAYRRPNASSRTPAWWDESACLLGCYQAYQFELPTLSRRGRKMCAARFASNVPKLLGRRSCVSHSTSSGSSARGVTRFIAKHPTSAH